ncbi:hypothetical protein LEP1GSC186_2678 [Leptospira noguchii serovar Autumnalis str. ZUN142]|uniref:Uncharacterized protein n=1 Tax=Leptospira noguchii serovar Autumnalis str. ZUN142 TaxID=1085540 RepID=M6UK47_9LEPT|nr:hypothetical protein LEP1GSC186_2678 [Leptospira noguchii serovar Autumnalis str. ZUN142]
MKNFTVAFNKITSIFYFNTTKQMEIRFSTILLILDVQNS